MTAALQALRNGVAGVSPPYTSCGPAQFRVVRENVRADLSDGASTRINFPELLTSVRKASDAVRNGASAERHLQAEPHSMCNRLIPISVFERN